MHDEKPGPGFVSRVAEAVLIAALSTVAGAVVNIVADRVRKKKRRPYRKKV